MIGLLEAIARHAADRPEAPALLSAEHAPVLVDYRSLAAHCGGLLGALEDAAGKQVQGLRIGVCAAPSLPQVVATAAAIGSSAVYANLNPSLPDATLEALVASLDPDVLVVDAAAAARLGRTLAARPLVVLPADAADLPRQPLQGQWFSQPEDLGAIAFTSGTMGLPKGCLHANAAFQERWRAQLEVLGTDVLRTVTVVPPLAVTNFMTGAGVCLNSGGTVTVCTRWSPSLVLDVIERDRVTFLLAVPTNLSDLVGLCGPDDHRLRSLREVWTGGGELSTALAERWLSCTSARLLDAYGMMDAPGPLMIREPKVSPAWQPMPGVGLRVVDLVDGVPAPNGTAGRLTFGGPGMTVMHGYLDPAGPDTARLRDGWVETDDLAVVHDDGTFELRGRLDDVLKVGGSSVNPVPLELRLRGITGIQDAIVIGVPDERLGHRVVAAVVCNPAQWDEKSLREEFNRHVAHYERLSEVIFVEALERDELGKLRRRDVSDHIVRRATIERVPELDAHGRTS